jgi:hypothetical protein
MSMSAEVSGAPPTFRWVGTGMPGDHLQGENVVIVCGYGGFRRAFAGVGNVSGRRRCRVVVLAHSILPSDSSAFPTSLCMLPDGSRNKMRYEFALCCLPY